MKEERDLNEDTLREMQKGPRIMVISHGIDEVLSELSRDKEALDQFESQSGHEPIPEFRPLNLPDEGTLNDIEAKCDQLVSHLAKYEEFRSEYKDKRRQVGDDIERYLRTDFANEISENPPEALSDLDRDLDTVLNRRSSDMVSYLLQLQRGEDNARVDELALWNSLKTQFIEIREKDGFAERFDELEKLRRQIELYNEMIINDLKSARKGFKDEFDIKEPEISESRRVITERRRAEERRMRNRLL
jgi:hypothetical protein